MIDPALDVVQSWLQAAYRLRPVELRPLPGTESDKLVCLATLPNGVRWVVRAYPPANLRSNVAATAAVLAVLEESRYPAERLIRAADGTPLVAVDGWRLLVTCFVAGRAVDDDLPALEQVGTLLGQLHALFGSMPLPATLPVAERSIAREVELSLADLQSVVGRVPPQLQALYAELEAACADVQSWDQLPHVLIHNDFHPGNLLLTPSRELTVIDWDGAGRSPATLDLGFALSSIHPQATARPDARRINALIDGYCRHHCLTPLELDSLFDAIRFRSLAFLSFELAQMVTLPGWSNPDYTWWAARYAAGAETADLARTRLQRYL